MKLFQTDITLCATLYVLAESESEAEAKASALSGSFIEFSDRRQQIGDDLYMTGESYSPDMPELSLSPAMTVQQSVRKAYLTEDFDEEGGE